MKRLERLRALVDAPGGLEALDQIIVGLRGDTSELRSHAATTASPELRRVALAYVDELRAAAKGGR
jgi:hypothetical protein